MLSLVLELIPIINIFNDNVFFIIIFVSGGYKVEDLIGGGDIIGGISEIKGIRIFGWFVLFVIVGGAG